MERHVASRIELNGGLDCRAYVVRRILRLRIGQRPSSECGRTLTGVERRCQEEPLTVGTRPASTVGTAARKSSARCANGCGGSCPRPPCRAGPSCPEPRRARLPVARRSPPAPRPALRKGSHACELNFELGRVVATPGRHRASGRFCSTSSIRARLSGAARRSATPGDAGRKALGLRMNGCSAPSWGNTLRTGGPSHVTCRRDTPSPAGGAHRPLRLHARDSPGQTYRHGKVRAGHHASSTS
jgi:hypothetical protein